MDDQRIVLKREEFYKKIWKTPMSQLASEYGLSDVGLKKICKKLNIPTPPRGYWARQQNGYKVTRTPLPKMKPGEPSSYTIYRESAREKKAVKRMEKQDWLPEGIDLSKPLSVKQRLVNPHPLTSKLKALCENMEPDDYGVIKPQRKMLFGLRVAPARLHRALLIFDTIANWFEANEFPPSVDYGEHSKVYIRLHGEKMEFLIHEKVNRIEHVPTKKEIEKQAKHSWDTWPNWDYLPTGKLFLVIDGWSASGVQKKWSDTASRSVEGMLHHFISNMFQVAYLKMIDRLEWEEKQRQRQLELERLAEQKRRREIEEQKLAELENQAAQWEKCHQLRRYINAVEKEAAAMEVSAEFQQKLDNWLEWARQHAERKNPLNDLKGVRKFFETEN